MRVGLVEYLDVVAHILPGLGSRPVGSAPYPFALEQVEEALGDSVVVTSAMLDGLAKTGYVARRPNPSGWNLASMAILLFGTRSPLVVEYEETCLRLDIEIAGSVSVDGNPRVMDSSKIIPFEEIVERNLQAPFVACAFSPKRRRELASLARSAGLAPHASLVDPTAIVTRSTRIGACSYVNAGAVIGALSLIGEGVLVNRAASLGHHTIVGDFVSIGPGATLASNVRVGDDAIVGAGAVLLPNVTIGARGIVSAGAVVRKSVGEGEFVIGNPAVPRRFNQARSSLMAGDDE